VARFNHDLHGSAVSHFLLKPVAGKLTHFTVNTAFFTLTNVDFDQHGQSLEGNVIFFVILVRLLGVALVLLVATTSTAATPAAASCRPGATAAAVAGAEHLHGAGEAVNHDFRGIAILPVLTLPFAGLQFSFNVHLPPLGQIFPADFSQFAEYHHPVPLGFFTLLATVFIFPGFRRCNGKIGNRPAIGSVPDLRILPQISHQNHFIDSTRHKLPSFHSWVPRLGPLFSCQNSERLKFLRAYLRFLFHHATALPASGFLAWMAAWGHTSKQQ
jgi:hypothetical protein